MVARIDRTGEENINNFGSKMIIIKYKNTNDINVLFPEYNWIAYGVKYIQFKKGGIKCPYEPRLYYVGYIGEGKYKGEVDGKLTNEYKTWAGMLKRCYCEQQIKKDKVYVNCVVCEEWHNFQNFAEWFENNYYEIENEEMNLDKDILIKGNKIYSPNTCIFVPRTINSIFTKNNKARGELPIGVDIKNNKFRSRCRTIYKEVYLGMFNTAEEAFNAYKTFKENYIKQVANEYKDKIPYKLYNAMYSYKVNIND